MRVQFVQIVQVSRHLIHLTAAQGDERHVLVAAQLLQDRPRILAPDVGGAVATAVSTVAALPAAVSSSNGSSCTWPMYCRNS